MPCSYDCDINYHYVVYVAIKEWCTRPKESCLLSRTDCSLYMNNAGVQGKEMAGTSVTYNMYMYYAMCGILKMAYKVILYRKCLQNKLHSISFPLFLSGGWGLGTRLPCQEWTILSEQRGKEKVCDSVDL